MTTGAGDDGFYLAVGRIVHFNDNDSVTRRRFFEDQAMNAEKEKGEEMKQVQAVAIVTIRKPGLHSKKFRKKVAAWLRRTADDYENLGGEYTEKDFHARCWFEGNAGGPEFKR